MVEYATEHVAVDGTDLYVLQGGSGRPCLVLHGIEGNEGWLAFHDHLAESGATVYAPSHPGYGHTPAPPWITAVQHQAVFYNWFLQQAGLTDVDLVGIGLGGWIAAEMAVMSTAPLRRLILVSPTGLRPEAGEMYDIFINNWRGVIERGFHDLEHASEYQRIYGAAPIAEFGGIREAGRVMSMRMSFKPYMYDPALPGMVGKIRVPTLVVWGADDQLVPSSVATQWQRGIPGARLELIDQCGHFAHLERPALLAKLIQDFTP